MEFLKPELETIGLCLDGSHRGDGGSSMAGKFRDYFESLLLGYSKSNKKLQQNYMEQKLILSQINLSWEPEKGYTNLCIEHGSTSHKRRNMTRLVHFQYCLIKTISKLQL